METQIWFELSQGKDRKIYTLWRCTSTLHGFNRHFQQNLSIEKELALEKAKQIAGNHELVDDSLDNLKDIVRGKDVIRFGKYRNKRLSEIPNGYLLWLAQGAMIPDDKGNGDNHISLIGELSLFCTLAKQEAQTRGLYQEYEDKLLPVTLIKYLEEQKLGKGHHFTNGEKIQNITCKCIKVTSYETQWGTTDVYTFKTEDGKQITYKGGMLEFKDKMPEGIYLDHNVYVRKGDSLLLSGTIQHDTYREEQVTYIKRPKCLLTLERYNQLTQSQAQTC